MNQPVSHPHSVENDGYDPHLVPAETAARKEREGEGYKHVVQENQADLADSLNASGGHTIDTEGLANNYAIEPEIYATVPGDLAGGPSWENAPESENTADLSDKMKATARDLEGKVQAAVGSLTGNATLKAEGEAKQAEAAEQRAALQE